MRPAIPALLVKCLVQTLDLLFSSDPRFSQLHLAFHLTIPGLGESTVLFNVHKQEGYILGGHPSREWLCAVLKDTVPAGSDFTTVQFRAALHAAFVRRQLQEQLEPVTSRWLVEVIVRSHALMVEQAEGLSTALAASGWRCGSGWLQFNPQKWRLLVDKSD